MKIHIVYFSATYTTRSVVQGIARGLGGNWVEHDLTNVDPAERIEIPSNELLLVGMPVYCGRIPEMAAARLQQFYGDHTKAVAVVVYGNREYDDALLELTRLVEHNGFRTLAASAFIGRHCIFPTVATHRPDEADETKMADFAAGCVPLLEDSVEQFCEIEVPGNQEEYCPHKAVRFYPTPTDNCTNCGTCAELCPTGAISLSDAREVDTSLCIACGRCVLVCSQNGRHFAGEMYAGASEKFTQAYGARKEPEFFFAQKK